ncbi:MAG: triphosphoribosyl-dephospho-CoA synthase [Methanomicrobiales archaeon]|nr:triphosphoribosyl-dephospho-CoA synthase [Methanomicrobiales archaeon]
MIRCTPTTPADRAQLAMMLEVCAYPKPGNVDRCHDFERTLLEHFLASTILVRPVLERAERGEGSVGELLKEAVQRTACHGGGNTHFGAFILLIPLVMGGGIEGARRVVAATTVEDAVAFYEAFALTRVRMLATDELDVADPGSIDAIRERRMTLLDVMRHSSGNDMVAAEWINGFLLTRRGADLLFHYGHGRRAIVEAFLLLLSTEPDTFIGKEHGRDVALQVMRRAREVREGRCSLEEFDQELILRGINPGSLADITIASLYVALSEGWQWE